MALDNIIHWKLAIKRFKGDKKNVIRETAITHPLHSVGEIIVKRGSKLNLHDSTSKTMKQSKSQVFSDPLSSALDGLDPLSTFTASMESSLSTSLKINDTVQKKEIDLDMSPIDQEVSLPWELHCSELRKFNTKQPLTLASSFLSNTETGVVKVQSNIPDRIKGTGKTGSERVKARLEQLDSLDEASSGSIGGGSMREMGGLTQEQFTHHLLALKEEMKDSWNEDQRVKALKIVIQCVKALALSSPEMFYPCKFAIISDLLDTLGDLVFARLTHLLQTPQSSYYSPKYEAEETARNWFYKVGSIRELLPRIYLEAALLSSYSLLPEQDGAKTLSRLIEMCRGIGDPLVGAYARTYIIHVGQKCHPKEVDHILQAMEDLISSCKWGWNGSSLEEMESLSDNADRSHATAEKVFFPSFKWTLHAMPKTHENLKKVLKTVEGFKSIIHYMVTRGTLKVFPPSVVSLQGITILQSLDLCFAHGENPQDPLVDLANVVTKCPPAGDLKYEVLNSAWQLVVRIPPSQNDQYLKAATAWLRFAGKNFTVIEIDKIFGDVLKRLSKSTSSSQIFYHPLLTLLTCALAESVFSEELYTLSSFRSLLSIFQRESVGTVGSNSVGELKKLLEAVLQHHKKDFTDTTVVHLLLSLFASLHDGINALTTQDEKRQISHLVNCYIRQVNFGKDFELQLQFYVDARAVFSSLDSVLESLIQHVLSLQMSTNRMVKGNHTGKTAAFERACAAYCFITIPSIACPVLKLKLYLLTGSVAMVNNCMGQGDACMKSAVKTVLEIASEVSDVSLAMGDVSSAINILAGYLIATPDPPDSSRPLYLFRGLEKSLTSLAGITDMYSFCSINLSVLRAVSASAMSKLPYHFTQVDGNDKLYGCGEDIRIEAEDICTNLLSNVIDVLKGAIGTSDKSQVDLMSELLQTILVYGDAADTQLQSLASSLMALVNKHSKNLVLKKELKNMYDRKQMQSKTT